MNPDESPSAPEIEQGENVRQHSEETRKRALELLRDLIKLLERYRDIPSADLERALADLTILKRSSTPRLKPLPKTEVEWVWGLGRQELVEALSNRTRVPDVDTLQRLARSVGVKRVTELSEQQLKQLIVKLVYDRTHEREHMLASLGANQSPDSPS